MRRRLATVTTLAALGVAITLLGRSPAGGIDATTAVIGAKVSQSSSRVSGDRPIRFDTVDFDGGGFFDQSKPDRLTVSVAGCYFVEAQITILGWGYDRNGRMIKGDPGTGNPESPNFIMEIKRNGNASDYVAADNRTDENAGEAQLGHTATVECFEVGEYIQLFVTPNRLVESNWPRTGGSLSPVLLMVMLGTKP
jgi:hypothetical protein